MAAPGSCGYGGMSQACNIGRQGASVGSSRVGWLAMVAEALGEQCGWTPGSALGASFEALEQVDTPMPLLLYLSRPRPVHPSQLGHAI